MESAQVRQEPIPYIYLALDPFPSQALLPKGGLWALMSLTSCYKTTLQHLIPKGNFTSLLRVFLFCRSCVQSVQPLLHLNLLALHAQVISWSQIINAEKLQFESPFDQETNCDELYCKYFIVYMESAGEDKRAEGKGGKIKIFWIFSFKW